MCKLIIAGTRTFKDYEFLKDKLSPLIFENGRPEDITEVVSGCSKGADSLGEQWAKEFGITVKKYPADWENLGRKAGPLRNIQMAEYGDILIAFWDGKSRGTKHMIDEMQKRNKPVKVFNYETR